jgi:DNA recombination protein RmuC
VASLATRRYDELVEGSVDFVVLFVPGDAFLSAALDVRPDLFELAADQDVILASPGTLLAFLRGVACGWRERQVADEAAEVAALGRELHERLVVFAEHFGSVGTALGRAVTTYNQALGSMERRLVVTARRLEDHGVASRKDLPDLQGLVEVPGLIAAPDLLRRPPDVA